MGGCGTKEKAAAAQAEIEAARKAAVARRDAEVEAKVAVAAQQVAAACREAEEVKMAAVERAAAEKAVALGLLHPLTALSLDAGTLRKVTAAAIAYCDHQYVDSFADLVERASTLIAPHRRRRLIALSSVALRCPCLVRGVRR